MKEFLIVFTDPHLAYSPTVLNLFYELKKYFKVKIIAPQPIEAYSSQRVIDDDVVYFKEEEPKSQNLIKRIWKKIKSRLDPSSKEELLLADLLTPKAVKIIELVKQFSGEIIAVDFLALWSVQQVSKRAHLISLEINTHDKYRDACDFSMIESVLIQSEERYRYLFKTEELKYFIVQNAPPFINFSPDYTKRNDKALIYCGSAMPWFGIFSCIDFIKDYPSYTLTIKGAIPTETLVSINKFYPELLEQNRLILDTTYLDEEALTHYVSRFSIGFAFYDFYRFENVRSFNYFTAPSGKVFQYFNSGVPVIANELKGFEIIKEKNAGILISHLSSTAIKAAIEKIEFNYVFFAENSKSVSKGLDFRKCISSYIEFLKN